MLPPAPFLSRGLGPRTVNTHEYPPPTPAPIHVDPCHSALLGLVFRPSSMQASISVDPSTCILDPSTLRVMM